MPDYNKGDFTQQGIDGFVEGGLHLNEKRCLTARISTDEETSGIDSIEINIHDHLNDLDYAISGENLTVGENVVGIIPSGNIEITENTAEGEPLDISQYATATVNVSGGGETPLHLVGSDENLTMELDEDVYVAFSENFTADDYIAYRGLPLVITINGTEYEAEPDNRGTYECGSFIVSFEPNGVAILSESDNSPISIKIESYVEMFVNTIRNEYEAAYGSAYTLYITTFANGRLTTQTITSLNYETKIATPAINGISKVLLSLSIAPPANDYYFVPTGDSVDIDEDADNTIIFTGSGNKVTVAKSLQ